jgi:uncharacterized protein DUF5946
VVAVTEACPGCGLQTPPGSPAHDGYFNTSPGCWSVYGEVLAAEFQDGVLFGQVHQLTVDAYAVQHAGGPHPDKSVCAHLVGLHLVFKEGLAPATVPPRLQRLVGRVSSWPHLAPPSARGLLTVFDVARARSPEDHATRVREWATQVWTAWQPHHPAVAELAAMAHK